VSIGVSPRFVSASEALLSFRRAGDVAGMALFDQLPPTLHRSNNPCASFNHLIAAAGLQPPRYLCDCSGCFRLEWLPGGTYTHWKAPPFHGRTPVADLASRATYVAPIFAAPG
jgi:hypothetical protein